MPGSADSAAVRSAHASTMVRARDTVRSPQEPVRAGPKQTTSHRPYPGREPPTSIRPPTGSAAGGSHGGGSPGPNDGDLFSNTATSKLSGISVGRPGAEGDSGSRSSGGRKARFWRAVAMEIHSPVSGSSRSSGTGGRGSGGRSSGFRSGGSAV